MHSPRKQRTVSKDMTASSTNLSERSRQRTVSTPGSHAEKATALTSPSSSRESLNYPDFSKAHCKENIGHIDLPRNQNHSHTKNTPQLESRHIEIRPQDKTSNRDAKLKKKHPSDGKKISKSHVHETSQSPSKECDSSSQTPSKESPRKRTALRFEPGERSNGAPDRAKSSEEKVNGLDRPNKDGGGPPIKRSHQTSSGRQEDRRPRRSIDSNSQLQGSNTDLKRPVRHSADELSSSSDSDATSVPPQSLKARDPGANKESKSTRSVSGTYSQFKTNQPYLQGDGWGASRSKTEFPPVFSTPPPFAPPSASSGSPPRVDYLVRHGGLHGEVSRLLLRPDIHKANEDQSSIQEQAQDIFAPIRNLLHDFTRVLSCNGSLAVATGYRSVARRLLDRLETIFARDITSEYCSCCMCQPEAADPTAQARTGMSWGEILEYVGGRKKLPPWPPASLATGSLDARQIPSSKKFEPMQKMDIDVPEEYRNHYIRQSNKTKQTVDRWLQDQSITFPVDVDDDTLSFVLLTQLTPQQRSIFTRLLTTIVEHDNSSKLLHTSDANPGNQSSFLDKMQSATQRLYHLANLPRRPEVAMQLLLNPELHDVLSTLAAISDEEWDVLISGRFDGFLRSGADDDASTLSESLEEGHMAPSNGDGVKSHKTRLASHGAPVGLDEDTEMTTLADLEQNIYESMEGLEDAFEALHHQAELVRSTIRIRAQRLAEAKERRTMKGGKSGTSDRELSNETSIDWEVDDGRDPEDMISELAPDDSASNISRNRILRPKRRDQRREPYQANHEKDIYTQRPSNRITPSFRDNNHFRGQSALANDAVRRSSPKFTSRYGSFDPSKSRPLEKA